MIVVLCQAAQLGVDMAHTFLTVVGLRNGGTSLRNPGHRFPRRLRWNLARPYLPLYVTGFRGTFCWT